MDGEMTLAFSLFSNIIFFLIACYNFYLARKKDTKVDAIEQIKSNVKLDQLCVTSNETRSDVKALVNDVKEVREMQIKNSLQIETIWKRVDELRSRIEELEHFKSTISKED